MQSFWGANKVSYWRCGNAEWINDDEKKKILKRLAMPFQRLAKT